MEKMKLIVENFEESLSPFPIWSVVYVEIENVSFPCQQWYDATTSILATWINALSKLVAGAENEVILNFMDGDYAIRLESTDARQAVACFEEPGSDIVSHNTIDLLYFCRQLLAAVGRLREHISVFPEHRAVQEVIAEAEILRTIIKESSGAR